jgi:aspartyl-tRNA(Asn)/glutamyl-tRNA(Gln) amidotransferase subunit B
MNKYEAIIGLEVHAQLKTKSKMFCACATSINETPNTIICPVCTGQPGTLPVVNKAAVEMAVKTGLALHGVIQKKSVFARKNYFYPDLPKGYQISQHELPLCRGGFINIKTDGKTRRISITRVHMEEDAGKLLHDIGHEERSHVDFNRCGVPLIEIVSGPDMRTPEEGGAYLKKLRNILVYLDVCEGNLQEGNFRCDANVSIRPLGSKKFGTRTELKNLNSFKAVEKALAYEIERQSKLLDGGKEVVQETRLWNDYTGQTEQMRSKEEAHDYRYFPDPDLLPLIVEDAWIEEIRKSLPELAEQKASRFVKDYGITEYDAAVITEDKALSDYFESCVGAYKEPKKIANWIMTELMRELKKDERELSECPVAPSSLAKLVEIIDKGEISGKMGKEVFEQMYKTGKTPDKIISEKGLKQVSDFGLIENVADKVIKENPKQAEQYKSGKAALFSFFVGQVMKETKGQANPQVVNEILKKKLG